MRAAAAPPLVIDDVTVVDVVHGRLSAPSTVRIAAGRIESVAATNAAEDPAGSVRVGAHGKFLVPGLVDAHVHLFNNFSRRPPNDWTFALFVANGVTGVREMAMRPEQAAQVAAWRAAVDAGSLVAPRVIAAGVPVFGASADEARPRVREAKAAGADFVKVFSEVPAPIWRAIVDEARRDRIPVDGHVPAAVSAAEAARAGQRTAEHLTQAYEACSRIERRLLTERGVVAGDDAVELAGRQESEVLAAYDTAACARTARILAAARQAQVPTLVLSRFEATRAGIDAGADPRWPLLRADEQARWLGALADTAHADAALAQRRWQTSCRIVRALHAAHAPILAGTDTPMPLNYPGYSLHDELELLVACGLDAAEALRSATALAAQTFGLADAGTIEAGRRADLVLLDADPLADIANLRRIDAVVLAGRLLDRAELDRLLHEH